MQTCSLEILELLDHILIFYCNFIALFDLTALDPTSCHFQIQLQFDRLNIDFQLFLIVFVSGGSMLNSRGWIHVKFTWVDPC